MNDLITQKKDSLVHFVYYSLVFEKIIKLTLIKAIKPLLSELQPRPECPFLTIQTLREKCPNTVFFLVVFSRIRTEYGEILTY